MTNRRRPFSCVLNPRISESFSVLSDRTAAGASPGGDTTESILAECANENLPTYRWSIDTEDWKNRDADTIYKRVIDYVQDGDIILLHEIYDSTADAVERIVPELKRMGFELVTCRELVKAKTGNDPELFTEYFDLK